MFHKSQIGRSMIEMLGVLAIIGVLSVGGLAGYSKAVRSFQLSEMMTYLEKMKMEIKTRQVSGILPTTGVYRCDDFIDEDMPMGMDSCAWWYNGGKNNINIHFTSNALLVDVIKKFGSWYKEAHQTAVEEGKTSVYWQTYQLNSGRWWSETYGNV